MGQFIPKAIEAFGLRSIHAVGLDVGTPSLLFAALARPELFSSLIVAAGAVTYPLVVEGNLKSMIEAKALPPLNAVEVQGRFLGAMRGYDVPGFVRDDYLASYAGVNDCHMPAWIFSKPVIVSGRNGRRSSSRSSRNGSAMAFQA